MSIEWLFFDIGSTLVDESECYRRRIADTVDGSDISFENYFEAMMKFSVQGLKGYNEAAAHYGLNVTPWHSELESLYPDAEAVLAELSKRYHIGIIANQDLGSEKRLDAFGLMKYIELVIASAEEGVAKPDRRIFDIALERAKCRPENAAMIGDRLDNDILPANKIGMTTVRIMQGFGQYAKPQNAAEIPNYTVDSLSGTIDIFC